MLQKHLASIGAVGNRDDLEREVVRFARQLEFDLVTATLVIDDPYGPPQFIAVGNTPSAFVEMHEDPVQAACDPVAQHCRRSGVPIVWDQDTYVDAGAGAKWEAQARYGYRTGIAYAMHMPGRHHLLIGVDRDGGLPADSAEISRMAGDLVLFAACAQDAVLRVLGPEQRPPALPHLTPRELEALRWTMEGKTAWEVGNILGIKEQTAARHVNNATQKLDCVNKVQAVMKAVRLGLIR